VFYSFYSDPLIGVSRWGDSSWFSQGRRGCCGL